MTEHNASFSDLVSDWGGFERLVADLHKTGSVSVEHNVCLPGRSGAPRQIDVLVRHKQGLYEHIIVVECKYRNSPIERMHVDALATTVREVGAARGVIFSTKGFQRGAVTQALHDNISLYRVRELSDEEWGLPGRKVELWLHFVAISIGNLQIPGRLMFSPVPRTPTSLNIELNFVDPTRTSSTPIRIEGLAETTIEELVMKVAHRSAQEYYKPAWIRFDNGAEEGVFRTLTQVNIAPPLPIQFPMSDGLVIAPRISFDLGIEISQSTIRVDRGAQYAFVLAIEDCINGSITTASRRSNELHTQLRHTVMPPSTTETAVRNGTLISIFERTPVAFENFSEEHRATGAEKMMSLKTV